MTMPVEWFETAFDIITELGRCPGKHIEHGLQTNMIAYHPRWNDIIKRMFGNSVGTSMDYPNLYRKLFKGGPDDYTRDLDAEYQDCPRSRDQCRRHRGYKSRNL